MVSAICGIAGTVCVLLMLHVHGSDMAHNTQRVQYQLFSRRSALFVGATAMGDIHAMGMMHNPRTVFYPHFNIVPGTIAFESACFPGKYLSIRNGTTLQLEVPTNDSDSSELFEETMNHALQATAYKSYNSNPHCFIAFDDMGNAHEQALCTLTTQNVDVLFEYIVGGIGTLTCDQSSKKLEL